MSGLPPIATEQRTSPLVRFVPKPEVAIASWLSDINF